MSDLLELALNDLTPSFADELPDWEDVLRRSRQTRQPRFSLSRHPRRMVAILVALVLVALLATPAFGVQSYVLHLLGRKNVSFQKSKSAPNIIKKQFFDMPIGAPPGLQIQINAAQARAVATFSVAGHPRRLWVAPTKKSNHNEF